MLLLEILELNLFTPLGTLVICPASLIKQWEQEIKTRVERDALDIYLYHGPPRIRSARHLAKNDVVITSYKTVVADQRLNTECLFKVKWQRVVLDEGHFIRNHDSRQSKSVCALNSKSRWILTGTPIQNKEFDLFAAVRFLRCSPFDGLLYWKRWIEVSNGKESSPRVQALLRSILLRRTKQQLIETGEVESLPEKSMEQINVQLNREERTIYNKLMAYSAKIFASYVSQQQQKSNAFTYDHQRLATLHKQFARRFNVDHEIQPHELLTLILRLRQACCHAGLIKTALKYSDMEGLGDQEGAEANNSDGNLLKQLENMKLDDEDEVSDEDTRGIDEDNEVFNFDLPSSKIESLIDVLREHIVGSDDKAIVVSQWTSYLHIVRGMLDVEGIPYCELTGNVLVKHRNDIVDDFNNPRSRPKIMLLSLTASGVGLNLAGANYLFMMDQHWNPQLEQQAQDRIYRLGQNKKVKIFR